MGKLRRAAYLFSIAGVLVTAWAVIAGAADFRQLTFGVAVMGGTMSVTPYMLVRALEEVVNEAGPR